MRQDKSAKKDKKPSFVVYSNPAKHRYVTNIVSNYLGDMDPVRLPIETKEKMMIDPIIHFGMGFNRAMICNREWWIECRDTGIKRALEENWRPCHDEIIDRASDAQIYGFLGFEKVWKIGDLQVEMEREDGSKWVKTYKDHLLIKKYKDLHPKRWEPQYSSKTDEYLGLKNYMDLEAGGRLIPAEKTFVHTVGKKWGNLAGTSRLKAAYSAWFASRALFMFTNRYFERKADPPIVAYVAPGKATDQDGKEVDILPYVVDQLNLLKNGDAIAIPNIIDEISHKQQTLIETLDIPERGDMFLDYIEYLDILKLRGIMVMERALIQGGGRGGGGSFASSDVYTETAKEFLQKDATDLCSSINNFILPQLIRYNFGQKYVERTPATFHFAGFKQVDKRLLGQMMTEIISREWTINGKKLTTAHMVDPVKMFRDLNIPYQSPQEAINRGAVVTTPSVGGPPKARNGSKVPEQRTREPKPGERMPTMPAK